MPINNKYLPSKIGRACNLNLDPQREVAAKSCRGTSGCHRDGLGMDSSEELELIHSLLSTRRSRFSWQSRAGCASTRVLHTDKLDSSGQTLVTTTTVTAESWFLHGFFWGRDHLWASACSKFSPARATVTTAILSLRIIEWSSFHVANESLSQGQWLDTWTKSGISYGYVNQVRHWPVPISAAVQQPELVEVGR